MTTKKLQRLRTDYHGNSVAAGRFQCGFCESMTVLPPFALLLLLSSLISLHDRISILLVLVNSAYTGGLSSWRSLILQIRDVSVLGYLVSQRNTSREMEIIGSIIHNDISRSGDSNLIGQYLGIHYGTVSVAGDCYQRTCGVYGASQVR